MRKHASNAFVLAPLVALAASAGAAEIASLAVYPPDVALTTARDSQRFLVVATRGDGVTEDVTHQAEIAIENASLVSRTGNVLKPLADGETRLTAKFAGREATAPIKIVAAREDRPVSFHLDVMPVFARAGCNTGSCHGAARGKDGFRLSLFGFDPQGDYQRITREIGGRRINLARPEASLLLEKAVGAVTHTGGKRFEIGSQYHETLKRWLDAGAPPDAGEVPAVIKAEIFPPAAVLEGTGKQQPFIVRAHYSGGVDRDVTDLATFMTSNDNSAAVTDDGLVTAGARGEAFISARFDTHTVGSQTLVLPKDLEYTAPKITGNYIDEAVGAKLQKLRILPSELCTDEEFLRRVTIDITGLMPTPEEYAAFMADTSPDKRAKKIDQLLSRKEFSEIWAMKWSELLMVKSTNQVSYKAMFLYSNWLTEQIANNRPLDETVRELLSATGGTFREPATNYYQIERDTLKTAENTAQVFLGIRTQCAQCHNHPFDRWTMDDYYGFAAFFSQIGRKQAEDYREQIIFDRGGGDVKHPVDGRVMAPKFLGGATPEIRGNKRRQTLAEWITSPDNPYFAKSVANRVWAHFFGIGIVEPVDDIRVSNPPSNPALFEELGRRLVEYDYDFKRLVRDICNSQTYQRSFQRNASNEHDESNFAHARVRRIPAESLLDSISQVTATKDKFRGLPLGARAVQIADGKTSTYFLTTFGRSERATVCACEASTSPTLSQALHLVNGATVHNKIREGGLVAKALQEGQTPQQVIETIYIRALARKPTDAERNDLLGKVGEAPDPQQGLEDVFWAVLNSREFLFNH